MIEKWKNALDNKKHAAAILTDLSKAFDCINQELLIAKLEAYGFDKNALIFIHSYITGRKQRTNVNNILSTWKDITSGVSQGSVLGPLLFNVCLNDMFFFLMLEITPTYPFYYLFLFFVFFVFIFLFFCHVL